MRIKSFGGKWRKADIGYPIIVFLSDTDIANISDMKGRYHHYAEFADGDPNFDTPQKRLDWMNQALASLDSADFPDRTRDAWGEFMYMSGENMMRTAFLVFMAIVIALLFTALGYVIVQGTSWLLKNDPAGPSFFFGLFLGAFVAVFLQFDMVWKKARPKPEGES